MQKKFVFSIILIILLSITGCIPKKSGPSTPTTPTSGQDIRIDLVVGQTTFNDVKNRLGEPDSFYSSENEINSDGEVYDECSYQYMKFQQQNIALTINIISSDRKKYTYHWKGRDMQYKYMILTFSSNRLKSVEID